MHEIGLGVTGLNLRTGTSLNPQVWMQCSHSSARKLLPPTAALAGRIPAATQGGPPGAAQRSLQREFAPSPSVREGRRGEAAGEDHKA